ncbi:multiple epidermal growth factor-like domains protein 6 [Ostrea edulis]|uniref:multiple epidermal growth factor-like domains protein 6 n=1 Tax=Ostrea edulis TaxID=37623 RepID=UPI0024AFE118|nr:multiple epidermal growth factor-like domains protein 6 [Ostrea edulis]
MYILVTILFECPPGYITNNCTLPCRYLSFGPACQEKCNCKESDCNSGTGCKEGVATLYPVSSSRGELTSSTMPNALNITICPNGYFGEKCEVPCRFPNHGNGCQLKCSCAEELCSHIHGCSTNNTYDTQCDVKMLGENRGRESRLLRGTIGMACVALIFSTIYCSFIILNNSEGV